jgi:hypothetical protein
LPEQEKLLRQAAQQTEALFAGELSLARLRQQLKMPLAELHRFKVQLTTVSAAQQRALVSAALDKQALENSELSTGL